MNSEYFIDNRQAFLSREHYAGMHELPEQLFRFFVTKTSQKSDHSKRNLGAISYNFLIRNYNAWCSFNTSSVFIVYIDQAWKS